MAASVAAVLKAAESKIGRPYVWGAEGPDSFDCSGLMQWAWKQAGVSIPRTSQEQAKYGTAVAPKDIRPGDLVTSNWGSGPSSHVAMYIGGGKVVHAPRPGRNVTIATMDANYRSKVNAIRRVPGASYSGVTDAGIKDANWANDFADIFPLPLPFVPDDKGGSGLPGLGSLDSLLAPFKAIGEQLTTIAGALMSVGKFAEFLLKLALPSTWVRIACGVLGSLILFLGLFFLVREARGAA